MRAHLYGFNPDEIDQITVIKDASAAIYGVQAAMGLFLLQPEKVK
jgi:TonB-dependent starch-binding outer membrane protein SusC